MGQLLGDKSWHLVVDENRECPSWHVTPKPVANQSCRNCFRPSMSLYQVGDGEVLVGNFFVFNPVFFIFCLED